MSKIDKSYHLLLEEIKKKGYWYDDPKRKDIKRLEIPSYTFRHELKDGFPILTTKEINYNNIITELLWFLKGDTNIRYLLDNNCNIWNKDAYAYYKKLSGFPITGKLTEKGFIEFVKDETDLSRNEFWKHGDLGNIYGHQWRNFNSIDQISRLIKNLKEQPLATDHIVNSWNVGDLNSMALPPCHYGFQIVVRPLTEGERSKIHNPKGLPSGSMEVDHSFYNSYNIPKLGFELHWQQRSVDTFLGLPYNIASYATLALIIEKLTGYKALAIQGDLKKVHIYNNSIKAVNEQLTRDINKYKKTDLEFDNSLAISLWEELEDIDDFIEILKPQNFKINNYNSYPSIKVDMLERNK